MNKKNKVLLALILSTSFLMAEQVAYAEDNLSTTKSAEEPVVKNEVTTETKKPTKQEFETKIDSMFAGVASKDGLYASSYDNSSKTVTVKILDETPGFMNISGTGLIAGLTDLYDNANLKKVKIGNQPEIDLKVFEEAAPNQNMTKQQMFKLVLGSSIGNAAQAQGSKTGKLADFVYKKIDIKLTIGEGEEAFELTYHLQGADKDGNLTDPNKKQEKPEKEDEEQKEPKKEEPEKKDEDKNLLTKVKEKS